MVKIDPSKLNDLIIQELNKYSDEVVNILKESTTIIAKECLDEIKLRSPVNKGKYKRGWKAIKEFENSSAIRYKVKNTTSPQLTHLLEFGHSKVNGGRVEGKTHIRVARDNANNKYVNMLKEGIKNAT